MIRQTSLQSYRQLKSCDELGRRQRLVFDGLKMYPGISALELSRKLGRLDPNFVRPRIKELADLGLVVCVGKRVCSISKRLVMVWGVFK